MNADELRRRADAVLWWHGGMDLGHGVVTKGVVNAPTALLPRVHLPDRLDGLSVIDIGAWDGYMAFECERRGASPVVAVDSFEWEEDTTDSRIKHYAGRATGRAGFDLAHEAYNSKVKPVFCEVLDLSPDKVGGAFDVVLFLGVLYHMRHPLLALERVSHLVKPDGLLIVETHIDMIQDEKPGMRFYPGAELNGDVTNWWGPNPACVEAMLRIVGFGDVQNMSWTGSWQGMGRVVYHARRSNA